MPFIDELDIGELGLVENNAHNCLSSTDGTVDFGVNFIDAD